MNKAQRHPLEKILENRIAIIDGAMGTTIRTYGMTEADIRGERFKDATKGLLNNGDLFSLTQPEMIGDIHRRFLEAGADIIETNTFGATSIAQSEFFVDDPRETRRPQGSRVLPEDHRRSISRQSGLGDQRAIGAAVPGMGRSRRNHNLAPALRGRSDRAADRFSLELARCRRPRIPGGHLRSGKDRLRAAGARSHRRRCRPAAGRDDLRLAQRQGRAGRHPRSVRCRTARKLPVMISAAVGRGGETMISAQTTEAFWNAVRHVKPLSVGLNCSLGPDLMYPFLEELSEKADVAISCYPNAGLPNPLSETGFRSRAARHGPLSGRFCRGGLDQHRRRLLRQYARAHRGDRESARGPASAKVRDALRRSFARQSEIGSRA